VSAKRIKKKHSAWNSTSRTARMAALWDSTPEMAKLLDIAEARAKSCAICDRPVAQVFIYTCSPEERLQFGIGRFGFGLCRTCFEDSEATKLRLSVLFQELAYLTRIAEPGTKLYDELAPMMAAEASERALVARLDSLVAWRG
jgi:hypothetical protein